MFVSALLLAGALASLMAAIHLLRSGDAARADRLPSSMALALTALWLLAYAALGEANIIVRLLETPRNLAWIVVIYRAFEVAAPHDRNAAVRKVTLALVMTQLLQPVLLGIELRVTDYPALLRDTQHTAEALQMLVCIGALVLVHNLYLAASDGAQRVVHWLSLGLAGIWFTQLSAEGVSYFAREAGDFAAGVAAAVHGVFASAAWIFVLLSSRADAASNRFRPSRKVAFRTLSLVVIGAYLLALHALTEVLVGGELQAAQIAMLAVSLGIVIGALLWLPTRELRAWLTVVITKNLFKHRYEYREEWLRFTRTLSSRAGDTPLPDRSVRALCDITGSRWGRLYLAQSGGELTCAANWNRSPPEDVDRMLPKALAEYLGTTGRIYDGAEADIHDGETRSWLDAQANVWAIVPLLHFEKLVGAVALGPPAYARSLDWEDFDILRVAGSQIASYLAERQSQETLLESRQFDAFYRRMAFVMHDVKNLSSQLSLMSRNAKLHADNPEYRKDMLVTLQNSADKMNALLARLGRYGTAGTGRRETVQIGGVLQRLAEQFAHSRKVVLGDCVQGLVTIDPERLEQALAHLVQNAIDAGGEPVEISVAVEGEQARISVSDRGSGMSAGFIENELFKPFVSTKEGGFGIGALEARDIVQAMGGTLEVRSAEGVGTTFIAVLPLAKARIEPAERIDQNRAAA